MVDVSDDVEDFGAEALVELHPDAMPITAVAAQIVNQLAVRRVKAMPNGRRWQGRSQGRLAERNP
jgi:hypothetical protein